MITVEKADFFSPESQYLIEKLSSELAAITGNSGKSHFTADSLEEERRCGYWQETHKVKRLVVER